MQQVEELGYAGADVRAAELSAVPTHVLPAAGLSGITMLADQLAAATGADVVAGSLADLDTESERRPATEPWHLHFSDRLLGRYPAEAADRVLRWAARRPLTVTLHDVPQPWSDAARRRCYVDVARGVAGWLASSHHEVLLLTEAQTAVDPTGDLGRGHVVPLPVVPSRTRRTRPAGHLTGPLTIGVLGWVYPDKGHREVIRAAGRLRAEGREVQVRCLGAAVDGHLDLVDDLHRRASEADVELSVSGFLTDDELEAAMRSVDVPVAAHHHLSASGSINSWLAAGRRPLVADGRYARELAALRPGTLLLHDGHDPDGHALDRAVRVALDLPAATWLPADLDLAPRLDDTAAAYRAWWAATSYAGPQPTRPVIPSW